MHICFFPDDKAANFHPLTLTRPVDDLRIGIFTIKKKWEFALSPEKISRIVPEYLEGVFPGSEITNEDECFWINPRFLPTPSLLQQVKELTTQTFISHNGDVVAAKTTGEESKDFFLKKSVDVKNFKEIEASSVRSIENLWDLISINSTEIENDIPQSRLHPLQDHENLHFAAQKSSKIFIAEDVKIEPGCILIADNGPIVIQSGAIIEAGSIIRGPVAICEHSTVKMASRIYGGTTVGPVCKVGGEVSACIFHSYTNKAHDGFAGSSIFGQWVNLGANTITSNLKNDYSTIKIVNWNTGVPIDSGLQFFGTAMGDHSKTAINTMLNTGTLCGVSSNLFINELSPKRIASFTWLGPSDPQLYRFDKALQVMRAMMKRRNKTLSQEYEKMMLYIFENRED